MMKKWLTPISIFVLVWMSLSLLNLLWINYTTVASLKSRLNTEFLEIEQVKTYSSNMLEDFKQQIETRLRLDLADISPSSYLTIQKNCRVVKAEVVSQTEAAKLKNSWKQINITIAPYDLVAGISVGCEIKWGNLLGLNFMFAALMFLAVYYLPRPLSTHQRHWYKSLTESGYSRKKATRLSHRIYQFSAGQLQIFNFLRNQSDDDIDVISQWCMQNIPSEMSLKQVNWFYIACDDYQQKEHALKIAIHDDVIEFDTSESLVTIHGLPLKLPKTPYFYFLWYAQKRLKGDGWQINPATNRPDKVAALELIQLMQQYGGHGKAINDLEVQGLTSKKLDQNRNKIKDELHHYLGDKLAENYLFESRRDAKSQRYWYRTHFDKTQIVIN
ncbi:hypothetical protein [Aliiglaciecola lipolytica]|uniref:Uncharacterized protein n=1 Tax=Aliiglaciecola lipolytica E3 TaxID=1127673 RepID=K6X4L0_9ALTE|nr:hypothetical protein [Aliiglaciecola lipolytica]GAC15569.1 hypothetical protein GLIP_2948 [Aliiglaciecola lipolytica E3]